MPFVLRLVIVSLLSTSLVQSASAHSESGECGTLGYSEGEYLIRFQEDIDSQGQSVKAMNSLSKLSQNFKLIHQPRRNQKGSLKTSNFSALPSLALVEANESSITQIKKANGVLSVQRNCLVQLGQIPNDPQLVSQWAIGNMNLPKAWEVTTGSEEVIIAVIDSGIDIDHEDLHQNIWMNQNEVGGIDGFDDDNNGCIDDIYGCDTAENDGDPRPGQGSNAAHGTHVAGIAAARGNNGKGISGASWNSKIMAIKGFPDFGQYARISDLLDGVYYAVNNGAHIINASWGSGYQPGQAEIDAFQYALDNNVLPIVAAGNEALVAQFTTPAGIPGVFTVGSINSSDELSQFSNYGSAVDILAPGGDSAYGSYGREEFILSTYPEDIGGYGLLKGTSMAAPFVAGVAALVKSMNMDLSARDIMQILVESATLKTVIENNLTRTEKVYPIIDAEKAVLLARSWTPTQDTSCYGITCGQSLPPASDPNISDIYYQNQKGSGCSMQAMSPTADASFNWLLYFFLLMPLGILTLFRKK